MDRERMIKLAEHIEAQEHVRVSGSARHAAELGDRKLIGFNMEDWVTDHDCGSTGCIAGWAVVLFDGNPEDDIEEQAADLLDLSRRQSNDLFMGNWLPMGRARESATPAEAAAELRRMVNEDV